MSEEEKIADEFSVEVAVGELREKIEEQTKKIDALIGHSESLEATIQEALGGNNE